MCHAEVPVGGTACTSAGHHPIEWANGISVGDPSGKQPTKPLTGIETTIAWGVFYVYCLIVGVLGAALAASLYLGTGYMSFSTGVVTALTTIAGYAVGVNASPPNGADST